MSRAPKSARPVPSAPAADAGKSRAADTTPRPRASRGKSGKPPAPPVEGAAGTPETKRSSRGFAEASAPFLPALDSVPTPTPSPSPQGGGESVGKARQGAVLSTLPALRNTGPPSRNFTDM